MKTLRDLGFGKVSLDTHIRFEARAITDELLKSAERDLKIDGNFNIAVLNVIWCIFVDKRFDYDDAEIIRFSRGLTEGFRSGVGLSMDFFPLAARMFPRLFDLHQKAERYVKEKQESWRKIVAEHKATRTNSEDRDFIDVYLREMENDEELTENDLIQIIEDFFVAGSETTSTTLMWFVMYLALNPTVSA